MDLRNHWSDGDAEFEMPIRRRSPISSVRANHSQNDERYKTFSRNHQCTCMVLTFLAYCNEGLQFSTTHLDRVLEQGDSLYVANKKQLILDQRYADDHLTVEEMTRQVRTDTDVYNVSISSVRCGWVKAGEQSAVRLLPLAKQLEALTTEVNHAALLVSPECFAVFRDRSGRYGLFDPHPRNESGFPHEEGTAIKMTFNHVSDLINHLDKLFEDHDCYTSYEFVPISFESVNSSKAPETSDGEMKSHRASKLYEALKLSIKWVYSLAKALWGSIRSTVFT